MSNATENTRCSNINWLYILAGAALVAGGIVVLSRIESLHQNPDDPIADAQRMLSRAQSKLTEIEAGLRTAREPQIA
ncbi:MAG TPA: hypothetical protein VGM51_12820 [Armatimonadota bacterium]|jgi:hypothetical protein